MPWYQVSYAPAIIDDLQKTDKGTAQRLLDKTKWLASNVANLRHEPLHQDVSGLSQYAVGDWRILYSIDREEHLVHIHRIAAKRELYSARPANATS